MRRLPGLLAAFAAFAASVALTAPARASILITVDKLAQQMTVTVDGDPRYIWPVSTGRDGYDTPGGQYTPFRMERDHFSREWDDAPMPYSIFFTKQGHAIHGTNHKIDGSPESHGCVRLSVDHAATLWGLVKEQGTQNVRVELYGHIPSRGELMARRDPGNDANASRDTRNDPTYRNNDHPADDQVANDEDDATGDIPPTLPRQGGRWRAYTEGGRVYYYREGPAEERRVYRRVYHYYRHFGGFPFW